MTDFKGRIRALTISVFQFYIIVVKMWYLSYTYQVFEARTFNKLLWSAPRV